MDRYWVSQLVVSILAGVWSFVGARVLRRYPASSALEAGLTLLLWPVVVLGALVLRLQKPLRQPVKQGESSHSKCRKDGDYVISPDQPATVASLDIG